MRGMKSCRMVGVRAGRMGAGDRMAARAIRGASFATLPPCSSWLPIPLAPSPRLELGQLLSANFSEYLNPKFRSIYGINGAVELCLLGDGVESFDKTLLHARTLGHLLLFGFGEPPELGLRWIFYPQKIKNYWTASTV
jgi:hypothetical protein